MENKREGNMHMATKYVKGRLYKIKIAELQADPNQARKYMDPIALDELTASIQKLGVLTPIQFRQDDQGAPVIVAGHRRVKAVEKAGLTEIAGTFTDGDTRLQGFVENLQREVLLPIDEAEEMDALMKEYSFNQNQLSEALGKPTSSVYETMTLNKLPVDIRDAIRGNPNITKSLLLEAAKQKTDSTMRRKFQQLMAKAAKAGQSPLRKEKTSKVRSLITSMDALTGQLDGFPWHECSEDDRNDLANAAAGIHRTTSALLTDMGLSPGEDKPESLGSSKLE